MLKSLGTNVSPLQPTTALATGGVYGWTRNPLYSGGTLVMLGIALIFAVDARNRKRRGMSSSRLDKGRTA
jgi:hypothetical protein